MATISHSDGKGWKIWWDLEVRDRLILYPILIGIPTLMGKTLNHFSPGHTKLANVCAGGLCFLSIYLVESKFFSHNPRPE